MQDDGLGNSKALTPPQKQEKKNQNQTKTKLKKNSTEVVWTNFIGALENSQRFIASSKYAIKKKLFLKW